MKIKEQCKKCVTGGRKCPIYTKIKKLNVKCLNFHSKYMPLIGAKLDLYADWAHYTSKVSYKGSIYAK